MLTTNQTSKLPYQKVRLCSLNLKKKYVSSQKDTDTSIMHSISPFDSKDTNSHITISVRSIVRQKIHSNTI